MRRRVSNPPNPWAGSQIEWIGQPPEATLEVYEEDAKSILTKNDSPDLHFRWGLNPYRGCTHGCAYCYARPTHEYLGLGAGTDFDRKIIVKRNAPELLDRELARRSWRGEPIVFSGVTDCYQALEARYELTRGCLEVCVQHRNPVVIITKSALVRRDIDLLSQLPDARVYVSVPFVEKARGLALEPWVASPSQRFAALRAAADAGIPTGIAVAPLIPGLNEHQVPEILTRAREAGASYAFLTLLRLPSSVAQVFEERLAIACPERSKRVLHALRDVRGGAIQDGRFGSRFCGSGPRWAAIEALFDNQCRRLGLQNARLGQGTLPTARPEHESSSPGSQGSLFGED